MTTTPVITILVNGSEFRCDRGTTVVALLSKMQITHTAVAVEIDAEICPRHQMESKVLESGQIVEVVSLVGGG